MKQKENNKNFRDSDADGLSDAEEEELNTDPFFYDSDSDELGDYQETRVYGTDPNNPDTDSDGVKDGAEVKMGFNPAGAGKLRDLFIPHKGNGYHPSSLHPKRVFFHAASVLAIKASVVMFMVFLPSAAWLTPDVLLEQEREIVSLTNELRSSENIAQLSENNKLRSAAFARAEDMLIKQYFAHTSPEGDRFAKWIDDVKYNYSVAGENLAMGFVDARGVMNGWMRSPTHYENLVDEDYKEIGVSAVDGVFNEYDTTLVVQLFGAPLERARIARAPAEPEQEQEQEPEQEPALVLGNSAEPAPVIDENQSMVFVETKQDGHVTVISAEAYIKNASRAEVRFGNYSIELRQGIENPEFWTGSTLVFKEDDSQLFSPVVLPSVIAKGAQGREAKKDIPWEKIIPQEPSAVDQYLFIKKQDSGFVGAISRVSSIYFGVMLILAMAALGLMVFVEIRKQHPKHIASGLGFIAVLVLVLLV